MARHDGEPRAPGTASKRTGWRMSLAPALALFATGGLASLIWFSYGSVDDPADPGLVPLIKADPSPHKLRPEDEGGLKVPHRDKMVFQRLGDPQPAGAKVERLLPEPDRPLTKPKPPVPPVSATAAARPSPPPPPSASPSTADASQPAVPVPPRRANAQGRDAGIDFSATYAVQLASLRDEAAARKAAAEILRRHRELLPKAIQRIARVDLGAGQGVYFRVQAGPFADAAAAEQACARLKRAGQDCLVVKPRL